MTTQQLEHALQLLPHGPEFRFLDSLSELDPGKTGAGSLTLRGTEFFFAGHFPGAPMFPGVLAVEAVAQLAGVVAQSDPALPPLKDLKLTAIRGAKILGAALPGQRLELRVKILGRMSNLIQAEGQVKIEGGPVILQTQITLSGDPP